VTATATIHNTIMNNDTLCPLTVTSVKFLNQEKNQAQHGTATIWWDKNLCKNEFFILVIIMQLESLTLQCLKLAVMHKIPDV
jgi:hypothetical protein